MTRVTLTRDHSRYKVEAHGHATGSAMVCCAVSTLLFTLAEHIGATQDDMKPGEVVLEWEGNPIPYEMVRGGFLMLEDSYPLYISVKLSEVFGEKNLNL